MRDKWETSVNSCGPRHPEWETSAEDKCKLMRPKAPTVGCKPGDRGKIMRPRDATLLKESEPHTGKPAWGKNYTSVDPKQMWKFSIVLYMRTKEPWKTSVG